MDGQPKDSGGFGYEYEFGFGSRAQSERPAAGSGGKRWVLHAGHGECGAVATASSSEGPHLARLRGFRGWGRERNPE
jgi:hypothetical protein